MNPVIKGADISSLTEVERFGGHYFDHGVAGDLCDILQANDFTAIRLRLWVDPFDEAGNPYFGGLCDLESILGLAQRIHDHGMALLLDLHYSDFWADPGKQYKPKAWENLHGKDLEEAVYIYTGKVLDRFYKNGIAIDYLQIGNEITNGMLWPDGKLVPLENGCGRQGYDALSSLLKAGIKAAREHDPKIKLLLHLERSGDAAVYREWLDAIIHTYHVDFDILGVSYYPYWHGALADFEKNMRAVKARYHKPIMIVETGYGFSETIYPQAKPEQFPGLVLDGPKFAALEKKPPFPLTKTGQIAFYQALFKTIDEIGLSGFFIWEPAWLPRPGTTWASPEAARYIHEPQKGPGNEWANQGLFDYDGQALPALEMIKNYRFQGGK